MSCSCDGVCTTCCPPVDVVELAEKQELPLEQLEIMFVLYVASKTIDQGMSVDDIYLCVETLQRLGQKYVEQSRRS